MGTVRPAPRAQKRSLLEPPPKVSGTGIGAYLAQQRRLRGIALKELADQIRIPVRSLERLENGAFDTTADGFTRGFVRTVAEALGLDADAAVSRMLAEPENTGQGGRRRGRWLGRRAMFILGAVAALGLAVAAAQFALDGLARDPVQPVRRQDPIRLLYAEQQVGSAESRGPETRPPLAERRR